MKVARNLDSALRHIRDPSRVRSMWVDAIYINQKNDAEKSIQVMQMWKVYQVARHTLIYLGDATLESNAMMKGLRADSSIFSITKFQAADILNRTWFTRIWILQELVFSADPWVYCGRLAIRWDLLYTVVYQLWDDNHQWIARSDLWEQHLMIQGMERARSGNNRQYGRQKFDYRNFLDKLVKILISRRGLGVQDARDMLFAHIGIAGITSDGIDLPTHVPYLVDYSKTKTQVYQDLAMAVLAKDGQYDFLHYAKTTICLEDRPRHVPTWMPDWTDNSWRQSREIIRHPSIRFPYPGMGYTLCETSSILACIGNRYGQINRIAPGPITLDDANLLVSLEGYLDRPKRTPHTGYESSVQRFRRLLFPKYYKTQMEPTLGPPRHPEYDLYKMFDLLGHLFKPQFPREEVVNNLRYLRIAVLVTGQLALVPAISLPGDMVCRFNGWSGPFILRPFDESNQDRELVREHVDRKQMEDACWKLEHPTRRHPINHCYFVGQGLANLDDWKKGVISEQSAFAMH